MVDTEREGQHMKVRSLPPLLGISSTRSVREERITTKLMVRSKFMGIHPIPPIHI
jgi:hypothetical protein